MSEEILVKMSNQIGELNGRLAATLEAQAKTNEALFTLVKDHETRLKDVESAKNKVIGAAVISGVSGSGIGAAVVKILGLASGHGS